MLPLLMSTSQAVSLLAATVPDKEPYVTVAVPTTSGTASETNGGGLVTDTANDRPGTYSIDGYNNPAYAWNVALDAARGDRIMMLASDCMLQPEVVQKARRCTNRLWMCSVIDIDSYPMYFLGPKRIAP